MKNTYIGFAVLVILILAGLAFYSYESKDADDMMESDAGAMMEEKGEDVMDDGESMMNGEETNGSMMGDEKNMESSDATSGNYTDYSPEKVSNADGKVLLFFRANWCPTCRALDEMIKAESALIPANLTILKVDYDTEIALRQKYGVTTQHTLVQVNSDGKLVNKWTGSQNVVQIVANLK